MLHGRTEELALIDRMVTGVRDGLSGTLVLRGPAGIGKTALLEHAAASAGASGLRVIRAHGIEFEAELPFAALHLLLSPVLDRIDRLPPSQATALNSAFGLGTSEPLAGDRFLIGLAVMSLLAELAEDGPVLCLADDAQWFDRASAEALSFAARRLNHEGVLLLFGVRDGGTAQANANLGGLPTQWLPGLERTASAALLDERTPGLAPRVRSRLLAETSGNPLALIELPQALTPEHQSGEVLPLAFDLDPLPLTERVQSAFGIQAAQLSEPATALLLVAATEETGDLDTILQATARLTTLDCTPALEEAERSGLLVLTSGTVAFKHPLARAAVLHGNPLTRRLAAHLAVAQTLCGSTVPSIADRAAWHRAAATTGHDEAVAAALEAAAHRARTRTGHAAQASALERAAELTPDPVARATRLIAAAEAAASAGDLRRAATLARRATPANHAATPAHRTTPPNHAATPAHRTTPASRAVTSGGLPGETRARAAYLRAMAEFEFGSPRTAARILLDAASAADGEVDGAALLPMLSDAVRNGYFCADAELAQEAASRLVGVVGESPFSTGLMGLARLLAGDPEYALPRMKALTAFALGTQGMELGPGGLLIAGAMGLLTGDDDGALRLFETLVTNARDQAMIGWLPIGLEHLALVEFSVGRIADAHAHAEEGLVLADSTGQTHRTDHLRCVLAWAAAMAGDETRCRELAESVIGPALEREIVRTAAWGTMALGLLDMGLGRYEQVLDRLETAASGPMARHHIVTTFAPDQVEAAVRTGNTARAATPLDRFRRWAAVSRAPWALAVSQRCTALTTEGEAAEHNYAEAVRLHQQGGRPFERARTDLLYGEWLRRAQRKSEARTRLRAALETFERLGSRPWAERATAELRATGDSSPMARTESRLDHLTPQELQVVRLAAEGLSNRDIAGKLFLSPRTVGYHLYKAYPKLGVATRGELARALQ